VSTPPHNPLKAPLLAVCTVALVILATQERIMGVWFVVCVTLAALNAISLGVVLSGRNPWWVRSPADRWWARKRGSGSPASG
jgi:hypothetical protein